MQNNPLKWASHLLRAFHSFGVEHAVISPGSRSAPLAIAAAIHPGIQKKVVLDERSSGFTALGIGKATGKPALLICTSGTAAANYFPAVIEARMSGVPMIILSADRPPHLRNLGSSQTIDQLKLYGEHAVFFHEAGEFNYGQTDLNRIEYLAKQAFETSIEKGGAAHINLPFRKPLEPTEEQLSEEIQHSPESRQEKIKPAIVARNKIELGNEIKKLLSSTERPLLIAGPANLHQALNKQIEQLSSLLDAPLIAEPGSKTELPDRQMHRYEQFLRNKEILNTLRPDLIIRFGDQPFTKSLISALESWKDVPLIHFTARRSWQDHAMSVDYTIYCTPDDSILPGELPEKHHSEWNKKWLSVEEEATRKLDTALKNVPSLTDGHILSYLGDSISNKWNVMLSNSLIPRDMAMFGKSRDHHFVNRGAAGIDGISSTASGIHFASHKPTCCITGDLAFLHDSNALLSIKQTKHSFVIVVVNNGGGSIFRMLPIYSHESGHLLSEIYPRYFETPQNMSILKLAEAAGLKYQSVATLHELQEIRFDQIKQNRIIECQTNTDASMKIRNELWNF